MVYRVMIIIIIIMTVRVMITISRLLTTTIMVPLITTLVEMMLRIGDLCLVLGDW